jgi:hypothetical protein
VHRMIEQSIVHLPELVKDIDRPVSNYLVHLSSMWRPGISPRPLLPHLSLMVGFAGWASVLLLGRS